MIQTRGLRPFTIWVALLVLVTAVLTACGNDDNGGNDDASRDGVTPGTTPAEANGSQADEDVTLRLGVRTGPLDVNPLVRTGVLYGAMTGIMEGLTALDPDASVVPALAESWTLDNDSMGITWELREGVTFHNGEDFTADDFIATWEAYHSDESTPLYRANLARVESVEAVAEHELRMEFSEPFPEIARVMASAFMVMPADHLAEVGSEGFSNDPVGTGPFRAVEFEIGGNWVIERFDNYWGESPLAHRIEIFSVPDESSRVARLETGDLDLVEGLAPHTAEQLAGRDDITVESFSAILATGLRLNTLLEPFDDARIRQAVNHAIDRESLVANVLRGRGTVGSHVCRAVAEGCPDVDPYSFDPDRSRELLAEAGYPDGLDVDGEVLLVETQLYVRDVYSLVVAQLEDVGIRLNNVQYLPSSQKIEQQAAKEFAATEIQSQNITYESAFDMIRHHTCDAAQSAMCDEELDNRIIETAAIADPEERVAALEDLWEELYELAPYAILYYQDFTWAFRNESIESFEWLDGYSVTIRDLDRIVPAN